MSESFEKIDSDTLRINHNTTISRKDIQFNITYFEGERDKIQKTIDGFKAKLNLLDK